MQSNRNRSAATGNSDAGYFGGGFPGPSPAGSTAIDKLSYSSETTVQVPGASFPVGHRDFAATGNQTNGYFSGGDGPTSKTDKITYASDTTAPVPGANLSVPRAQPGATGNSTHGYFAGGWLPGASSTVEKITYSSDTTALVPGSGANLSVARYRFTATGNSTHGYFAGGQLVQNQQRTRSLIQQTPQLLFLVQT